MSDSQTNFTLTDPAIEPIDLNRMDEFLFSAMLRASIHLGGSHTPSSAVQDGQKVAFEALS